MTIHLNKFFQSNFCWFPDSCQREAGMSSCETFRRSSCNRRLLFGMLGCGVSIVASGKKKAHKHNFFCPVGLGTPPPPVCPGDFTGFVPGTNSVKSPGQMWVFSLFYIVEARQTRVCPRDKPSLSLGQTRGRREAQKVYVKKSLCAFFVRS